MKNKIIQLLLILGILPLSLLSCSDNKRDPERDSTGPAVNSDALTETEAGTETAKVTETEKETEKETERDTEEDRETEPDNGKGTLDEKGWCAVGLAEDGMASVLADNGSVVTVKYTGNAVPGLIHGYVYDKKTDTAKLSLPSTFPPVADTDSAGNDLSVWNMGAYPSSSSIYYGQSFALPDDAPVFVRYSNTEWRLAHGSKAFASDGLTRGYLNANGNRINFVMIVGACGSLENMQPANAEVTQCMDPDGMGFERGNISIDGSSIPESGNKPVLDENGLTIPDPEKSVQTLIYKNAGRKLYMSFYRPTRKVYEKAPVYYLITGGGWNYCDRQGMVGFSSVSADILRKNGFAVTSIDYRIMQDGAGMNGIISDCMDGIRYLVKYADKAGIDPERIVIAGHSAGGHLALMTALGDQNRFTCDSVLSDYAFKPLGCVGMSALTVCYKWEGKLLTAVSHLPQLFVKGGEKAEHEASPLDLVSKDMCPVLLTTGDSDPSVYPENTYLFRDSAEKAGADITVIISERAGHSYEAVNGASDVSVSFPELQKKVAGYILDLLKNSK